MAVLISQPVKGHITSAGESEKHPGHFDFTFEPDLGPSFRVPCSLETAREAAALLYKPAVVGITFIIREEKP